MNKSKVFMIMPFEDEFFEVYEMLKRQFDDKYEFSNAGDEGNQQNILKDIIQPIYDADIIIADLTGLNANVLYELGVAHTFNKKTIIITKDKLTDLPFDLKQYRAKDYSTHFMKFAELLAYLRVNLDGAITGNIIYSNPVKDYISDNNIFDGSWFSKEKIKIPINDTDKGFLDFISDIENDTNKMTDFINRMAENITNLGNQIQAISGNVERVKATGGSGTTNYIRKEAKKIAGYLDVFDKSLRLTNTECRELWNSIEKNILGLLENKIASSDTNKESLKEYMVVLHGVQASIWESNQGVESFKASINNSHGIERTLNQAIRFLDEDLANYLENMYQMSVSIDRIKDKSKFVIGNIEWNNYESF